jgi:hypothetical protein
MSVPLSVQQNDWRGQLGKEVCHNEETVSGGAEYCDSLTGGIGDTRCRHAVPIAICALVLNGQNEKMYVALPCAFFCFRVH